MMFYEDFVKKLETTNIDLKENYKLGLNKGSIFRLLTTAVPVMLIGAFTVYSSIISEKMLAIPLGLILLVWGWSNLKKIFAYKIVLDLTEDKIEHNETLINFDEVVTATLKEMLLGKKRLEICLDIITKDKKQIIIPLFMTNRMEFTYAIKSKLKHRFEIKRV